MIKRALGRASEKKLCGQDLPPRGRRRLQHLVVCVALALPLAAGAASPAHAVNGDPVDGEGLFQPDACEFDVTTYCDDSFNGSILSCNQRRFSASGALIDQGLAMKVCEDGIIARAGLGTEIVGATDFGSTFCGQDTDQFGNPVDFCIVCKTFVPTSSGGGGGGGRRTFNTGSNRCVRIENVAMTSANGTCGAFDVRTDPTLCESELADLEDSFEEPNVGFFTRVNESLAGKAGATQLVLCEGRRWQCLNNPAALGVFAAEVEVQEAQTAATIHTPGHVKLSSGRWYCY